jgi:hypothetical protein
MPGTTLNPFAFSLPAGHRLSTAPELMLLKDVKLEKLE